MNNLGLICFHELNLGYGWATFSVGTIHFHVDALVRLFAPRWFLLSKISFIDLTHTSAGSRFRFTYWIFQSLRSNSSLIAWD